MGSHRRPAYDSDNLRKARRQLQLLWTWQVQINLLMEIGVDLPNYTVPALSEAALAKVQSLRAEINRDATCSPCPVEGGLGDHMAGAAGDAKMRR